MEVTLYDIAARFVGLKEVPGPAANPAILAMLRLDGDWPQDDAVPWCSAWLNYCAWLLRLPRSKSLLARSWLDVGVPVPPGDWKVGFDVVVLSRPNAGPTAGHCGLYAGASLGGVTLLGGNQGNAVSLAWFDGMSVLGVRRLA